MGSCFRRDNLNKVVRYHRRAMSNSMQCCFKSLIRNAAIAYVLLAVLPHATRAATTEPADEQTDSAPCVSALTANDDDKIIASLVTVRGIGTWTAEMYLMFELRRLDVWPVDDLGVRQGYGLAWGLVPPPLAKELAPLGDPFRPYRSIVARYCWEAVALLRGGTDPSLR